MSGINRRHFLAAALGGAFSLKAQDRKPNIVIILADDLGYGDIGCYGSAYNSTPNLDALATKGLRFTDFHSSGAVCSPTRAGLMTGRYQQRCGIPDVITAAGARDNGLRAREVTFATQLKKVGYQTAIYGKWHLGYQPQFNPDKHGFDDYRGYVSGNVDYFSHVDQAGHADWWHNSTLEPEEGYTTDLITKHALRFIEANKSKPFLLYLPHEAVHAPYQGREDQAQRRVGETSGPQTKKSDIKAVYRKMLSVMDESVGEVMAALKRHGLESDTFVFFCSDNGATPEGSNGACRGFKASVWEGGHRVPAIAYWPGKISPGQTSNATSICMDIYPTVLEIAGAQPPTAKLDGISLLRHIQRGTALAERSLFWAHGPQRAMRQGDWKLVKLPDQDPFLSNLKSDPGEKTNLAAAEPARTKAMLDAIAAWEKDVNAPAG